MFEISLNEQFIKHIAEYIEDRLYVGYGREQQLPIDKDIVLWIREAEKTWKQQHSNLRTEEVGK